MEIAKYNNHSGNKDLSKEIKYNKNIPFIEILTKANELRACLIVKTSYINESK